MSVRKSCSILLYYNSKLIIIIIIIIINKRNFILYCYLRKSIPAFSDNPLIDQQCNSKLILCIGKSLNVDTLSLE